MKIPSSSVWQLLKSYWQSADSKRAYGWYAVLIVLTVAVVVSQVVITYWYNYFYNALQAYDQHKAVTLLFVFFAIAFTYIALFVVRFYVWQVFAINWRRWLTDRLMQRWLTGRGYYYLETFDPKTDNPDQRLQEDAGNLVSSSLDLSINLIANILSVIGFGYVLWQLSEDVLNVPLGPLGVLHIHGYLMWVALLYCTAGTLLTLKIGYPLVALNFEQQHREATFRFAAMDLRAHSEHVALYNGEHHQQFILKRLFSGVLENFYRIVIRETKLFSFTSFFGQLSVALPLVVIMPLYFHKVILLGGFMQSLRAFGSLQDSLSFIVNVYPQIADWHATGKRLTTFADHLDDIENKVKKESKLHIVKEAAPAIMTKQLTISTPQATCLLKDIDETFVHGHHYLIQGASGIGKSTFMRVLAGIWPFASGEVVMPSHQQMMYLPQKPYMPIGTLAEAILFPDKESETRTEELIQVLQDVHLSHLIPRLHETASWSQQLSPGEQQRVAFARVLLHRPDWVFLDESTSMLDLNNEQYLYNLLKTRLPHCSLVSIGHRSTLAAFHGSVIDMSKYAPFMVS